MALCKVAVTDGVPALFVDGERVPPVLYGLSDIPASRADTAQAQRNIRQFAGAGVRLRRYTTAVYRTADGKRLL